MSDVKERSNLQTPIEIALGIDKDGKTTARKLYEFLELAKDGKGQFFTWAKANITGNPFAEKGVDYERFDIDIEGHKTADYWLSANFAKKLSMLGKTEKAEQASDYFAKEIEKQEKRKEGQLMQNGNLIKINNHDVSAKEYQGQRVVTFKDIDMVHERVEGTAKRNFQYNKKHFVEGKDFFIVCVDEIRTNKIMDISNKAHQDIVFITESGYLKIAKSLADGLALKILQEFVNTYFTNKKERKEDKDMNEPSKTNTNDLIVKDVDLFGDTVIAAQDKDGVIWAGVKWFCDGLGLSEGQAKSERKKLREDLVLSKGTKFHPLGKDNANSDVLCLQLNYVPLWLAKISITPNMKKNNPELVDKLIKYQLKAKDVLAAAFLPEIAHDALNKKQDKSTASDIEQFTNIPDTLDYHGIPVITTAKLMKYYETPNSGILQSFYKNQNYFEEGVHYFLLKPNEEIEFRKENGLNTLTKIYLC